MTCIVGLKQGGKIWMGADSLSSHSMYAETYVAKKVFFNGDFLFGASGSFRGMQLLEFSFNPPKHHPDTGVLEYMATSFINAVRSCFQSGGVSKKESELESSDSAYFLVAYKGELFRVQDDYSVVQCATPYMSIGSGGYYALGAMAALPIDICPEVRVLRALEIAAKFTPSVAAPFHIESMVAPHD